MTSTRIAAFTHTEQREKKKRRHHSSIVVVLMPHDTKRIKKRERLSPTSFSRQKLSCLWELQYQILTRRARSCEQQFNQDKIEGILSKRNHENLEGSLCSIEVGFCDWFHDNDYQDYDSTSFQPNGSFVRANRRSKRRGTGGGICCCCSCCYRK